MVTVGGATGTSTYAYQVVAVGGAGNGDSVPSLTTTISNGNANLGGANYNAISWQPVSSATGYKVIRLQGSTYNTGWIGGLLPSTTLSLNDYALMALAYPATLSPPGTLLDHTIFASSTTKLSSQTAVLEVALTLATS